MNIGLASIVPVLTIGNSLYDYSIDVVSKLVAFCLQIGFVYCIRTDYDFSAICRRVWKDIYQIKRKFFEIITIVTYNLIIT